MSARARAWNAAMTATPGELDLVIAPAAVRGAIPPELRGGRHLQNGPGWTQIGDRLAHPFDGHGFARALDFSADGGARLRSRFVRTPAYEAERAAGRIVYRGLGTNRSDHMWGNWFAPGLRNVANTTIVPWAGRLLCAWEGGRPYAVDPESLATRGEETFGGALPEGAFLAHMRIDARAQRLVGLNMKLGVQSTFTFREFDAAGKQVATREATLPGARFIHDFVVTPRWYVLPGNPMKARLGVFLQAQIGQKTLIDAIATDAKAPGTLILVPRGRPGPARVVTLPQRSFVVHFANAFDLDERTLAVDLCAFESFEFGHEFGFQGPKRPLDPALPDGGPPQRLYRATVSDGSDDAAWRQLSDCGLDFPRVHPDRDGLAVPAIYASTRADRSKSDPFDSIARVDAVDLERPTDVWSAGEHQFVGEPVFAPRPGAAGLDDGWVVALVSDGLAGRTEVCVFDAQRIAAGPIASVSLPLQPYGFHGAWEAA